MAAPWNDHLLTLEEYDELPYDNSRHYELHEGVLIVTPRAIPLHQKVAYHLEKALDAQLPYDWDVFNDVEIVLRSTFPSIVRAPDVVVVSAEAAEANPPRFTPDQVLLAVEIISPGSRNTDTITKPVEYAAAGIPHYWVIDLDPPLSLTAYHLAGDLGYQEAPAVTQSFSTSEPFPLDIDLTALPVLRAERRKKADQ
ncbi:Uma2 family endonuclease [Kibdelosporangium banguiense]|uniref:Uma2 family endonuclease n=1 Tax=Kibdelosporangium banguiense TaxID=1365924 RepID=A0ABS4U060_9PSEU|nr:Uma2 family endonuclease [Kibdelosporangium banguiense]MBP2330037.1 Uma2 family endonuclease [Kibdelosporangium banguiense]